ncbi:hypothetical protein RYX36_017993, partial [Vicia faba]
MENECNFFKWVGDEDVDGRDLKIERQKKKIFKLKNEVVHARNVAIEIFKLKNEVVHTEGLLKIAM